MQYCRRSTFVNRSNVSLSCKCFPVLLARSIHFPLNHLMFGLRRRSLPSTLAMKLTSPPLDAGNTKVSGCLHCTEMCALCLKTVFGKNQKICWPVCAWGDKISFTTQSSFLYVTQVWMWMIWRECFPFVSAGRVWDSYIFWRKSRCNVRYSHFLPAAMNNG